MNEHAAASEALSRPSNTQKEEKKGSIILGTILLVLAFGLFGLGVFLGIIFLALLAGEVGIISIYSLFIIGVFVLSIVLFGLALRKFYRRIRQLSAEGNSTKYTLAKVFTIFIIVVPVLGVCFFPDACWNLFLTLMMKF